MSQNLPLGAVVHVVLAMGLRMMGQDCMVRYLGWDLVALEARVATAMGAQVAQAGLRQRRQL